MKERYDTLQNIVKHASQEIGLNINLTGLLSSADPDANQLARFVIASAEDLLIKFPWRSYLGTDPWVKKEDGSYVEEISDDSDTPLIDARLLELGARWRYLHSKGFNYSEDFRSYELRRSTFAYHANRHRTVDTNTDRYLSW